MKKLKTSPSNDELLELYALYKQGTVGDNTTAKPGIFDMKGKAKWTAWDGKKGNSQLSSLQKHCTYNLFLNFLGLSSYVFFTCESNNF